MAETEPDLTLEARRLVVTVEDRGTAKALVIASDDVSIEIVSEPGPDRTAAGGYEELARESFALVEVLRARATEAGKIHPLTPKFTGEHVR